MLPNIYVMMIYTCYIYTHAKARKYMRITHMHIRTSKHNNMPAQVMATNCAAGLYGGGMYIAGGSTADLSGLTRLEHVSMNE